MFGYMRDFNRESLGNEMWKIIRASTLEIIDKWQYTTMLKPSRKIKVQVPAKYIVIIDSLQLPLRTILLHHTEHYCIYNIYNNHPRPNTAQFSCILIRLCNLNTMITYTILICKITTDYLTRSVRIECLQSIILFVYVWWQSEWFINACACACRSLDICFCPSQ